MSRAWRCSCGLQHCGSEAHVIARRQTADGKTVQLWSDGQVTWALGHHIRGAARAREGWSTDADLTAGWVLMGEVCTLDAAEVPAALQALRAECRKPYDPSTSWRWRCDRSGPTPAWTRTIICRALAREAA